MLELRDWEVCLAGLDALCAKGQHLKGARELIATEDKIIAIIKSEVEKPEIKEVAKK